MKTNKFPQLKVRNLKIGIVRARFNEEITAGLLRGALKALKEAGIKETDLKIVEVPGSFEIPLAAKRLAAKKLDGIVTLGAVIRGETAHFEYISEAAIRGTMKVMLNNDLPVALGIITAFDQRQARSRSRDDGNNKGYEAAMALIETLVALKKL